MLTRLRVSGFKNLVDVDVRFGPFTCIAGANGVGKSNLFDAMLFLSALADRTLMDAARTVRGEGERTADPRHLFFRIGSQSERRMTFRAEMIVPREGVDDLGATATASATLLEYGLTLEYRNGHQSFGLGELEIVDEQLRPIARPEEALRFPHSKDWRAGAVSGRRTTPFIDTDKGSNEEVVRLFQDGREGRALERAAPGLKRTMLSSATAQHPTAFLARRELQSWRLLQLEPSALREPDPFTAPVVMGVDGAHLPASLFQLAPNGDGGDPAREADSAAVYARVANRLSELIGDVGTVSIDRDDRRQLLTLQVTDRDGTTHPARSLSDGTLRFLALTVLEAQPSSARVLCLEEPENGIHPARIPAMLRLLRDIAVDVDYPVDDENPLRQVLINTHSPAVVAQVPEDCLLLAEPTRTRGGQRVASAVTFRGLAGTWRTSSNDETKPLTLGRLLAYLNPIDPGTDDFEHSFDDVNGVGHRVIDHPQIRTLMPVNGNGAR